MLSMFTFLPNVEKVTNGGVRFSFTHICVRYNSSVFNLSIRMLAVEVLPWWFFTSQWRRLLHVHDIFLFRLRTRAELGVPWHESYEAACLKSDAFSQSCLNSDTGGQKSRKRFDFRFCFSFTPKIYENYLFVTINPCKDKLNSHLWKSTTNLSSHFVTYKIISLPRRRSCNVLCLTQNCFAAE